jgi:hypothetical protein
MTIAENVAKLREQIPQTRKYQVLRLYCPVSEGSVGSAVDKPKDGANTAWAREWARDWPRDWAKDWARGAHINPILG